MLDDVYSTRLLSLSAAIPHIGRLADPQGTSTKHARLCGSVVTADVVLSPGQVVVEYAQDVKACALGQASAAILGGGVMGADLDEIVAARDILRSILDGNDAEVPARFADLDVFVSVRDYRARHGSVMLAFEAAAHAVEQAQSTQSALAS